MNGELPPVPFPLRSLAALLGMGIVLICYCYSATPPGPTDEVRRNEQLIAAVRSRDAAATARLLAEGADPNMGDRAGRLSHQAVSLLAIAAAQDDLPTMEVLLAHGANVNAAHKGLDVDERWSEAEKKQDRSALDELEKSYQTTPLMEAVIHDNLAATQLLLNRGASVDFENDIGFTALMLAVGSARPQVIQILIAHGADVNARSKWGETPLSLAGEAGQSDVATLLRWHGGISFHKPPGEVLAAPDPPTIKRFYLSHEAGSVPIVPLSKMPRHK